MASPGLAVPEKPHQPLSCFQSGYMGRFCPYCRFGNLKDKAHVGRRVQSNLTTQVLVAPALSQQQGKGEEGLSLLDQRSSVFDGDEFDVFRKKTDVDLSNTSREKATVM